MYNFYLVMVMIKDCFSVSIAIVKRILVGCFPNPIKKINGQKNSKDCTCQAPGYLADHLTPASEVACRLRLCFAN